MKLAVTSISHRQPWVVAVLVAFGLTRAPLSWAAASDTQGPEATIRQAVDKVFAVLREPTLQQPSHRTERVEALRHVADQYFDWDEMARRSLGPTWRTLDPAQRQHFVSVFERILAKTYIDDFDQFFGDEKVDISGAEQIPDGWMVRTVLTTHSREHVSINYYLSQKDSRWWVHDFSIENISQVAHYREVFARLLANKSFSQLMAQLERQVVSVPGG